jgi:hypothetical protein
MPNNPVVNDPVVNDPVIQKYDAPLQRVFEVQARIVHLHPFLSELFPIAVVEGGTFHIFEPISGSGSYRFAVASPTPMPVPQGVRAAFPLEALDGAPACIVTGEVFDDLEGYVTIFHEFIHCHQWVRGEQELREDLPLARKAKEERDMMWEIAYPFPYDQESVVDTYRSWMTALELKDHHEGTSLERAHQRRQAFRQAVSELDWDYATWQEWKEGFARYLENLMRAELGLPRNEGGREGKMSRVTFYAGGALLVERLAEQAPELLVDLPALFQRMR